jgi:septal ring factor EnvC (AmiA/AmiB activator)
VRELRTRTSLVSLLLIGAAITNATAADPATDPEAARHQVEQAERARAEDLAVAREAAARAQAAAENERRLAQDRAAAAARLRDAEAAVAAAEAKVETLTTAREAATARLRARAADLAPMLPLMQRLSLYPAETLLVVPAPPDRAVTGLLVLQGITREIGHQAEELRREQTDLLAAARAEAAERRTRSVARAEAAAREAELDHALAASTASRTAAEDKAREANQRAAAEAARAETLRALIASLEAEQRAAERKAREEAAEAERQRHEAAAGAARRRQAALAIPTGPGALTPGARPHGQLITPVIGTIEQAWGAATDAGPATGLTFQARPAAHVVSPCRGKVVFAAPFRSFGLLMIVDCGGGYHVVLAGLARFDVEVGRTLEPGEPVGVMPPVTPGAPGRRPLLYVELRHAGQPVNPGPWMSTKG